MYILENVRYSQIEKAKMAKQIAFQKLKTTIRQLKYKLNVIGRTVQQKHNAEKIKKTNTHQDVYNKGNSI